MKIYAVMIRSLKTYVEYPTSHWFSKEKANDLVQKNRENDILYKRDNDWYHWVQEINTEDDIEFNVNIQLKGDDWKIETNNNFDH